MLFKNGELINVKGDSDEAKHYQEQLKWVEENLGFPVIFKRTESYISYSDYSEDKNGQITKRVPETPMIIIPNVTPVSTNDGMGTDEWRWSRTVPRKKDGEYVFPRDSRSSKFDTAVFKVDKKDFDFAYFLSYKNPNFSRYYVVEDKRKNAVDTFEMKVKEAKIINAFYGEDSILRKDDKKLREIARAWNIRHIETMTNPQILGQLETAVREQDHKGIKSIEDFLDSLKGGEDIQIGAMVQKAEDLKIVGYDHRTSFWFFLDNEGNLKDNICEVPKQEREYRYEILKEEVSINDTLKNKIQSLIGAYDIPDDVKLNFDDLEHEDWSKVQEYCRLHDIKPTAKGRNKAMVYVDILKHAGYNVE